MPQSSSGFIKHRIDEAIWHYLCFSITFTSASTLQMEEARNKSSKDLNGTNPAGFLLQNPFLAVLRTDTSFRVLESNSEALSQLGKIAEQGVILTDLLDKQQAIHLSAIATNLLSGQTEALSGIHLPDTNNTFNVFACPVANNKGEILSFDLQFLPEVSSKVPAPDLNQERRIVRLESQLADLDIRFRTLADNFPQGHVSILDENLDILFSGGEDFQTDKGPYSPKPGDNLFSLYGENYAAFLKESLEETFRGKSDSFELNFGSGTFSFLLIPLPDEKGRIRKAMKIVQNISAEKSALLDAHHRREYLRQIIDVDPNFIYVKDRDNNMIVANKTIADFFGVPVKEFLKTSEDWFSKYKWNYQELQKADKQVIESLSTLVVEEAFFHPITGKMHLFQVTRTPFVTKENELSILCVGVDITGRVNTENELVTQREYLRQILDTNPSLIFVKEPEGPYLLVNKAFADYYKMSVEELTGLSDWDLPLTSEQKEKFAEEDRKITDTARAITTEEQSLNPHTGEMSYFVVTKKPLMDAEGNRHILGIITDVTDLKLHQDRVQKSEFLLQQIFNKVVDALFIIDFESLQIEDCNPKASELMKAGEENSIKNQHLYKIRPFKEQTARFWQQMIDSSIGQMAVKEFEMLDFNEEKFWGSLALTTFTQEGRKLILLRISDISLQKETEEHIIQSLHEKEILIQEIHHRVKNNMAVISSLLQLQSGYIKDPNLVEVFRDSQSRIKSMALIHEKLYQSSTLAKVEMESYIKELTRTLFYSYNGGKIHLDVNTNAANVFLDINSAVPCGLIINEVFSNACKHAFTGRTKGKIDINFTHEGEFFELEIRDDGVGMPEGTDFNTFRSLGMNLVQALSSQLGASLEYQVVGGFGIKLRFVEKTKPSREKVRPGA